MKRILSLLLAVLVSAAVFAEDVVYVLRLDDEVDARMWQYTRRAIKEARGMDASLFVVHINTYGGAVDSADSIRTALLRLEIPTVAFVDHNAASAGSLITLACDSVYMAPGSSMGASTVVNQTGEPMPDKYQSYMKSIMRSTAESHGKYYSVDDSAWHWRRDPAIAESFVTPDSVLSFTPREAIAHRYAEGVATSVEDVVRMHKQSDYRIVNYSPAPTDTLLGFLAGAGVRAILIMLIIGGIYMEMHSPGLGVAAGVAIVAAALYFLPMLVTGTMATWVVILFIAGVVLLALEMFVIPGFGVCGVAGILAILASLVGGMLDSGSIAGAYTADIVTAICVTLAGLVMSIGLVWLLTSKYGPKWVRRVSELQLTQQVADGYIAVDMSVKKYVNSEGVAVTDLRPSGKIRIGDNDLDAVSLSGFIDAGSRVRVLKYENAQLYVTLV